MTCNDDVDDSLVWMQFGKTKYGVILGIVYLYMQNQIDIYHRILIKMLTREPVAFFCYFSSFELMTKGKKEIIEKI